MEAHPSSKPGRAEVDTSRPFRSVKEAVAVFGERILGGEIHANKPKDHIARKTQQSSSGSFSSCDSSSSHLKQDEGDEMVQNSIKKLEAELAETKRELKVLKEKESRMEMAVSSLNGELQKSMSKLAGAETSMAAAARWSSIKSGDRMRGYGEQGGEIVEEEKAGVGKGFGRLKESRCLAELLKMEEGKVYYATSVEEGKKMIKEKPIVPLVSDLWKKKGPVSHYSYLYSCPSYFTC